MEESPILERCKCNSPQSFARYHGQSCHSDVTIICKDGVRIPAHKVILCLASPFFEKALDPEKGFQEAQQNEIKLEDHETKNITALIEFIYLHKYTIPSESSIHEQLLNHASVHATGDYFMVPCLLDAAHSQFADILKNLQGDCYPPNMLPSLIEFVYTSTPASQRGLRDVVLDVAARNYGRLIEDANFELMMNNVGEFSRDMATHFFNKSITLSSNFGGRQFLCTYCVDRYSIPFDGFEGLQCKFCRRGGKVVAIRD